MTTALNGYRYRTTGWIRRAGYGTASAIIAIAAFLALRGGEPPPEFPVPERTLQGGAVLAASGSGASVAKTLTYAVTKFGAKGDGVANDRAAIQKAVDQAGANGGGVVYFPKGVYLVDDSIVVSKDNVILKGVGPESEIRITKHPKRVVVISGSSHNAVRYLQVSLGVGDVQRHDNDEGIYVTNKAKDFLIEKVLGNGKGIMARGEVDGGVIRDNIIKKTLADGIHLTGGSKNIVVENNLVSETGDDSIAVVSYKAQQMLCSNITIRGNRIYRSHSRGIAHVGGEKVLILNNRVINTTSSGILIDRDGNYDTYAPDDTRVEGNTVKFAGAYALLTGERGNSFGIEVSAGALSVVLVGNAVSSGAGRGISVSAPGTLIQNNVITGNGSIGLQVDGSDCSIIGNVIENNGTYGFFSEGSDRLIVVGNQWLNNNTSGGQYIDNFLLKDSRHSIITDNESMETRERMQVERAYELVGSCQGTTFDRNKMKGTLLGTDISCSA
ncbi:right-handed parallel beta-helix repeat-containing protein [Cohnella soli]|uniref:Right-handed parallel beta-helix repeat-containing protein n=1 Tax=Cohnella soli TaxID=425005 RepID=A0ABW0I186_9BACL